MTRRTHNRLSTGVTLGLSLGLIGFVPACEEEPPPPPPAPVRTGPIEPPTPGWQEIAEIVPLHAKVNVRQAVFEGTSEDQMIALFKLLNGFAAGDEDTLRPLLDSGARRDLDELIDEGEWESATSSLEEVRLEAATDQSGTVSALIAFESAPPNEDVTMLWEGRQRGDLFVFSVSPVLPSPPEATPTTEAEASEENGPDDGAGDETDDGERQRRPNDPRRHVPTERPDPGIG